MWNPNDLTTLYATEAGTTRIAGDGATIGLVKAKLGNAHAASQSTAGARPTYKTTPNRLVYGTDDALLFGAIFNDILAGVDSQFSIVACVNGVSQSATSFFMFTKYGDSGENQREVCLGFYSGKIELTTYINGVNTGPYRISDSTSAIGTGKRVVTTTYDGSTDGNGGLDRFKFWIDGISDTAVMAFTAGAIGDIYAGTAQSAFGGSVGSAGTPVFYDYTADIGPILLINGVLSASEIAQINNYFMEIWL